MSSEAAYWSIVVALIFLVLVGYIFRDYEPMLDHDGEPLALWAEVVGTTFELVIWSVVVMIPPLVESRLVENRKKVNR